MGFWNRFFCYHAYKYMCDIYLSTYTKWDSNNKVVYKYDKVLVLFECVKCGKQVEEKVKNYRGILATPECSPKESEV